MSHSGVRILGLRRRRGCRTGSLARQQTGGPVSDLRLVAGDGVGINQPLKRRVYKIDSA